MRYSRVLSLLAAAFLGGIPAAPALNLTFSNSSGISGSNVWVMFGGQNNGSLNGTLTYSGSTQSIVYGQSYQLSEISGPINLVAATAGKIFVSYGANLNSDGGQYSLPGLPDFQYNSLDSRWQVRWDKVEYSLFSSTTQQGAINLSAVDFYSIPMQIVTSLGGVATGTVGWHPQTSTATVFYNLGSLATGTNSIYAVITSTSTPASPYSVQVTFSNSTTLNTLRIANPSAITQAVPNPFPSLLPYALSTSGTGSATGTSANLTSYYVGAGTTSNGLPSQAWAAQSYAFTSTVTSSGNMVISGSGQQVGAQTITIREQDLEGGLYSNAPDYYLSSYNSGATALQNSNCVYDQIISDVFAAYNMGLVGSSVIDSRYPGTAVGTESSGQWYSVVGTSYYGNPLFKPEQLFAAMQPNSPKGTPYYNAFAGYLAPISDIYGFPYTDKSAKPQLNITPGAADTMVITLLPDVVPVAGSENPGPNQLPIAIRDNQFSLSYLSVRGKPALNTSDIKLHLQIKHPRISDLTVRLVSPSGKTYLIHDRTGGNSANLVLPGVSLPESRKESRQNGLWMLVVKDSKRGDTGQLIEWSLEFP